VYDSGNYQAALEKCLELAQYQELRAEQTRRRESGAGRQLGIGLSSYVEMCGLAPSRVLASLNATAGGWEAATVRVLPTAKVQVVTGTSPHGQGHETCWSMIVADQLGISPDDVAVLHSDTAIAPYGLDTYGSRSVAVGGTAVYLATKRIIDKARQIAAHQLEAAEEDVEFTAGNFAVKGSPDRAMSLAAVAFEAFTAHNLPDGLEPNLEASSHYDPSNFTFPFGTHLAVVEVDTQTGQAQLLQYAAVDDCGNQINPLIVEGQIHGGIVQGAAQALWEDAVYDEEGNLVTATLLDYLMPSAAELPSFQLSSTVTPSPANPMGVKGIGEAGTIAATPAVINAVLDALAPYGIRDIHMPASPQRIWEAIRSATSEEAQL
jgi:carbon-monoxide dehydrogenase large subunit